MIHTVPFGVKNGGGAGSDNSIASFQAGEDISGDTLVKMIDDKVYAYQVGDEDSYDQEIGFTVTSVLEDAMVPVRMYGIHNNPGWGLTPGAIYYAASAGGITETIPTTGLFLSVGVAKDADNLDIRFGNSLVLI